MHVECFDTLEQVYHTLSRDLRNDLSLLAHAQCSNFVMLSRISTDHLTIYPQCDAPQLGGPILVATRSD